MGAVAGAAVSVVGGIAGLSQQNSAAAAQKRMLASQEKQQALNAQLQYLTIKNQSYADDLSDQINSNVRTLAYTQSMQNLQAQENLNQIAVQQSLFDSGVQKTSADINKGQQEIQTAQQLSNENAQAGAGELEGLASAAGANVQDINSILQRLSQNGDASTGIANLLDIAASSGGINEALSLLTGGDVNSATISAAQLARSQEVMGIRGANAEAVADSSRQVAGAQANTSGISGSIQQSQSKFDADTSALDARTSGTVAGQGFAATRAANTGSNKIGILSDNASAFSRKYLSAANLAALDQGAALQSDIINAQKSQIKTPGFLDFVGVGVNSYNTYRGLGG
jgi:hypothetical protein